MTAFLIEQYYTIARTQAHNTFDDGCFVVVV